MSSIVRGGGVKDVLSNFAVTCFAFSSESVGFSAWHDARANANGASK